MKKYFMKETDDELQFGDVIELDFVGDEDGVTKHSHLEVKFLPELVEELLDVDVIEEREIEDEDDLIDFSDEEDYQGFKEAVAQDIDELMEENSSLKERVKKLEEKVAALTLAVNSMKSKNASPKKK